MHHLLILVFLNLFFILLTLLSIILIYSAYSLSASLIISLWAEPVGDDIHLCNALTEYKWVTLEEAKNYNLIEGIYEELEMLDKKLKTGKVEEWKKNDSDRHNL